MIILIKLLLLHQIMPSLLHCNLWHLPYKLLMLASSLWRMPKLHHLPLHHSLALKTCRFMPQAFILTATNPDMPQHSLAWAVSAPMLGRLYVSSGANFSPRLRATILQGKDINLISLILSSPEWENKVSTGENFTVVIKSVNRILSRDMSIGEFVVAFGIYIET